MALAINSFMIKSSSMSSTGSWATDTSLLGTPTVDRASERTNEHSLKVVKRPLSL